MNMAIIVYLSSFISALHSRVQHGCVMYYVILYFLF